MTRGRVRVEPCAKRVRCYVGGSLVLDSSRASYVWEVPYFPAYYVPMDDVTAELIPTGETHHSPSRGEATVYDVKTATGVASGAAIRYADSPLEELRDLVRVAWDDGIEWLEEDEPVYTHPRDPNTRVDILASSRHVRVEVDGVTVAESRAPRVLYETGLPPRFYLPMSDVRLDLLEPTDTVTHCPYKGAATYWDLVIDGRRYDSFVWCYRSPFPESQKVAGMLCFFNEKVELYVDGVRQDRPNTKFS
ncbi:MAG: DUF427 domain-containing protein [Actinomycetes bacterium]